VWALKFEDEKESAWESLVDEDEAWWAETEYVGRRMDMTEAEQDYWYC
jgi:nitrogen fixation-related uncharacterized protein